jgi:hypothetical protein
MGLYEVKLSLSLENNKLKIKSKINQKDDASILEKFNAYKTSRPRCRMSRISMGLFK